MRVFRSLLVLRILSALTLVSFGLSLYGPVAIGSSSAGKYGEWLRLHLPTGHIEDIESAIQSANSTSPRSLNAFLEVFVSRLDATPGWSVAEWLNTDSRSSDEIIRELERRFDDNVDAAVQNRVWLSSSPVYTSNSGKGGHAALSSGQETELCFSLLGNHSGVEASGLAVHSGLLRHMIWTMGP